MTTLQPILAFLSTMQLLHNSNRTLPHMFTTFPQRTNSWPFLTNSASLPFSVYCICCAKGEYLSFTFCHVHKHRQRVYSTKQVQVLEFSSKNKQWKKQTNHDLQVRSSVQITSAYLILVFSPTPKGTLPSASKEDISTSVSYESAPIIIVSCKKFYLPTQMIRRTWKDLQLPKSSYFAWKSRKISTAQAVEFLWVKLIDSNNFGVSLFDSIPSTELHFQVETGLQRLNAQHYTLVENNHAR